MTRPLITVLLPTYEPNCAFLHETLYSLIAQTEERWTCCISDDASSINVRKIVEPYLQDSRFCFVQSPRRLGIGENWNACRDIALRAKPGSPFIQYLFQDDTWHPTYLAKSLAVLDEYPDIGFVVSGHHYICEENIETAWGYERLYQQKKALQSGVYGGLQFLQWWIQRGLEPNIIGEPSFVLMRRDLIERVGSFCEDLEQLLDVEYWVRLLQKADWYYIAEDMGAFRVHRHTASHVHFLAEKHIIERWRLWERVRHICSVDIDLGQYMANIIGHGINRLVRGKSLGKEGRSIILFIRYHPFTIFRGFARYLQQATRRWWKKGWAACTMMSHGKSPDTQYSVDRVPDISVFTARERSHTTDKRSCAAICGGWIRCD